MLEESFREQLALYGLSIRKNLEDNINMKKMTHHKFTLHSQCPSSWISEVHYFLRTCI